MGVFVKVQHAASDALDLRHDKIFEVRQSPSTTALVSGYRLIDLATGEEVSQMERYPRCTETGLTLFIRMLKNSPSHVLAECASGHLNVALQLGPEPSRVLEREILDIRVEETAMVVDLLSPAALVAGERIYAHRNQSVRDAICKAMGTALGWGELPPGPPIPLSDVPLRRTPAGDQYVRLMDVPPLTRQYLRLHFCRSLRAQRLPASLWRAFLLQCTCEPPDEIPSLGRGIGGRIDSDK